jgi:hypothetical protein
LEENRARKSKTLNEAIFYGRAAQALPLRGGNPREKSKTLNSCRGRLAAALGE